MDLKNIITKQGLYQFGVNCTNMPTSTLSNPQWYVLAIKTNDGYFLEAESTDLKEFWTGYFYVSLSQVYWTQCYTTSLLTNSALLSPLASALGVGIWKIMAILTSSDDVLTLTTSGFYECMSYNAPQNLPSDVAKSGVLLVFVLESNRRILVFISPEAGKTYKRIYWDNSWGNWIEL